MIRLPGWILRLLAGLLLSGALAPLTLRLADQWHCPWIVYGSACLCLLAGFSVRRRSRRRR
jgi:hypothetical protein